MDMTTQLETIANELYAMIDKGLANYDYLVPYDRSMSQHICIKESHPGTYATGFFWPFARASKYPIGPSFSLYANAARQSKATYAVHAWDLDAKYENLIASDPNVRKRVVNGTFQVMPDVHEPYTVTIYKNKSSHSKYVLLKFDKAVNNHSLYWSAYKHFDMLGDRIWHPLLDDKQTEQYKNGNFKFSTVYTFLMPGEFYIGPHDLCKTIADFWRCYDIWGPFT